MTNFFVSHNAKALNLINNWKNEIFSFLEADPNKSVFNHIITISNNKNAKDVNGNPVDYRNINNGFANFRFDYQSTVHSFSEHIFVRVETNVFKNKVSIKAKVVNNILNAPLLIFGTENELYISQYNNACHLDNSWLLDKSNRSETHIDFGTKVETYYEYDLDSLLSQHKIIKLLKPTINNNKMQICICHDSLPNFLKDANVFNTYKDWFDYNVPTNHIKFVQLDPRTSYSVYYGFEGNKYTDSLGTLPTITAFIKKVCDLKDSTIYQKLHKGFITTIDTGKACPIIFKVRQSVIGDINYDQSLINDKGEIIIYLSRDVGFDIEANKTADVLKSRYDGKYDREAYDSVKRNKMVTKVRNWLKKNGNEKPYPKKWTNEEIELANSLK